MDIASRRSLSPTSPPEGESDEVSLREFHVNELFQVMNTSKLANMANKIGTATQRLFAA